MPLNHNKYNELPDHQYTMIGKVIVEFSNIDTLLGTLLSRLLLTPEFLGRSYADHLLFNKTLSAIKQALDVHKQRYNNRIISEEKAVGIKDVLGMVQKIQERRNKFAHSNFGRFVDDKIFVTKFSGKPPNKEGEVSDTFILTDDELKDIYDKAYSIVETLDKIIKSIKEVDEGETVFSMIKRNPIDPSKPL